MVKYDKELLERVLRELENEKIRLRSKSIARQSEVYEKIPRIAEIDASLRSTVLEVIRASFGKGEDTAALIAKTKEENLALQKEREALLTAAGYPLNYTDEETICEICDGEGYANGSVCPCVAERYRKAKAAEINSRLSLCNGNFSDFDLSLYPQTGSGISPREQMREVYTFCRDFAEGFESSEESLCFCGGSGLGKTFLASCIAKTVAEKGFSVVFETAFSVFGTYEDVKFGRREADTGIYETCDLLILDDVGSEMSSPFSNAVFLNLINVRRNACKNTIVISPLPSSELRRRYGDQMFSRLEGDFIKLEFLGDDVRLKR
ncbi:MAG: DNA replication protein DnaC [Ruminococcaceae bacterium]|nr:DNA replication protein DnaC [Oscillospiraceae bacterium]